MTTIVHRTPGLLDVRAFTVMGMSAKPTTDHPIGQFGTGLKYSIAGLLRSGASVDIWIGGQHWQFETSTEDFRGAEFVRIFAWVRDWGGLRRRRIELPFTTTLGPHWTWWMWLRELHSNTLDEGGETMLEPEVDFGSYAIQPDDDHTMIIVRHPEYSAAWERRDDVFLPDATALTDAPTGVLQLLYRPSTTVFYRGVRALDTRLPCLYTYNVLQQTPLTEDRTMPEYYGRHWLATYLVRDCDNGDVIRRILEASDEHWEHDLEFPHHIAPSETFERAARGLRRISGRVGGYIGAWAPPPPPDQRTFWERRGRQWQIAETQILDERGGVVLEQPESLSQDDWRDLSEALVLAVRPVAEGTCPTCQQPIVPPQEPIRLMTAADLYAGIDRHEWEERWVGEGDGERPEMHCITCGIVYDPDAEDDMIYSPCDGPVWMQPDPEPAPDEGRVFTDFGDY